MSSSDCLILLVEEYSEENTVGCRIYVLYDTATGKYLVRGQEGEHMPYSFNVKDTKTDSICYFTQMILGDELCRMTLYNHWDLPPTNEQITYDYLNDNLSDEHVIVQYKVDLFSKSEFRKALEVIKDLFNNYEY